MALTRSLRYEILRRDNHTCRYCGATAPDVRLTVDHVIPQAHGGTDEPTNLVTACQPCNTGKAATAPDADTVDDVAADAQRWAAALQAAATDRAQRRQLVTDAQERFAQGWGWKSWPDRWEDSIEKFIEHGLDADALDYILAKAHRRCTGADHTFRWFCKVAWAEVTELQDAARAQLTEDPTPEPEPEATDPVPDLEQQLASAWNDGYHEGRNATDRHVLRAPAQQGPPRWLCIECDNDWEWASTGQCAACWDNQIGAYA